MSAKNGSVKLVSGNSNPALAKEIAKVLGLSLTKASVRRFADNEIFVEVLLRRRISSPRSRFIRRMPQLRPARGIMPRVRTPTPS